MDTYDIIAGLKPESKKIRVLVNAEEGIPDDIQAKCLFDFERNLREKSGLDVWVLKQRMQDDSKLRVITDMRRAKK